MHKIIKIFSFLALILVAHNTGAQCSANFSHTVGPNGQVQLQSTSTGVDAFTTYTWNFVTPAPTPSVSGMNLTQPAITYTSNGFKIISLTVFSPSTSCSNSIQYTVNVNTVTTPSCVLNANFSYSSNQYGVAQFQSATTGSTGANNFSWKFGDGGTASTSVTNHTYLTTNTYTVKLTVTDPSPSCNDSIERVISVFSACNLTFNTTPATTTAGCNGSAAAFFPSACPGAVSYTWVPGGVVGSSISACAGVTYSVMASAGSSGSNCCSVGFGTVTVGGCSLNANYFYSQGANGLVNFQSTTTGTQAGTFYNWAYGDGSNGTGFFSAHTYSANGVYIATLTAISGSFCSSTYTAVVNVTSYCPLNSSFFYSPGQGGFTSFFSTSTGTTAGNSYTWSFGDQTSQGPCVCPNVSHTYSNTGTFTITLGISNGSCQSTSTQTILIDSLCTLVPGLSYTLGPNWSVNFKSTFSGTTANTTYFWNFGDNSFTTGASAFHTYLANGTYTVRLQATNSFTPLFCVDSAKQVIVVNSNCNLAPVINHTVGSSGNVTFNSASTGTNQLTRYLWRFGDGTSGTGNNVTHTYNNGGAHLVSLIINDSIHTTCRDSITQSINITGISCTANPNFTLVPTGIPKFWNAVPVYPWNVIAASWNWGDGSTSPQLFTSHQYSVAATYSICLTVTVSCGSSAFSCSSYYVYKPAPGESLDMININVVPPGIKPVGVTEIEAGNGFRIYPNPNNGKFIFTPGNNMDAKGRFSVIDFTGKLIITADYQGNTEISLFESDLPAGIYFIHVAGNLPQKMIISR